MWIRPSTATGCMSRRFAPGSPCPVIPSAPVLPLVLPVPLRPWIRVNPQALQVRSPPLRLCPRSPPANPWGPSVPSAPLVLAGRFRLSIPKARPGSATPRPARSATGYTRYPPAVRIWPRFGRSWARYPVCTPPVPRSAPPRPGYLMLL